MLFCINLQCSSDFTASAKILTKHFRSKICSCAIFIACCCSVYSGLYSIELALQLTYHLGILQYSCSSAPHVKCAFWCFVNVCFTIVSSEWWGREFMYVTEKGRGSKRKGVYTCMQWMCLHGEMVSGLNDWLCCTRWERRYNTVRRPERKRRQREIETGIVLAWKTAFMLVCIMESIWTPLLPNNTSYIVIGF